MILAVREVAEVESMPASAVQTAGQQRAERKAPRDRSVVVGYWLGVTRSVCWSLHNSDVNDAEHHSRGILTQVHRERS